MKLPEFKNKTFDKLTQEEKLAMAERVAMEHYEYLKAHAQNTAGLAFLNYWQKNMNTVSNVTCSDYMKFYYYSDKQGLSVVDSTGALSTLKFNTKEIICFINNVVNPIPFKSPIIERLLKGQTIVHIEDEGVDAREYGNQLPNSRGMRGVKKGKPVDPNSLSQRVKRGELTRYEAYQKKTASEDDAL